MIETGRQEVVIPEYVLVGIMEIRRLQEMLSQDPILGYIPPLEFPKRFVISPRDPTTKNVRYWYEKGSNAETYIVQDPPETDWRLSFFAAYWLDDIFGLPQGSNKLIVQLNGQEIRAIFLLNYLKHMADLTDTKDIADLDRCKEKVKGILHKIKIPIVRKLEQNEIALPQDANAEKYI